MENTGEKVYLIGVVQSTIVAPVSMASLPLANKLSRTHETFYSHRHRNSGAVAAQVLENNKEFRPRSCCITARAVQWRSVDDNEVITFQTADVQMNGGLICR